MDDTVVRLAAPEGDAAAVTEMARQLRVAAQGVPVRTTTEGAGLVFVVPIEVAERAGYRTAITTEDPEPEPDSGSEFGAADVTEQNDDRPPARTAGKTRKGARRG